MGEPPVGRDPAMTQISVIVPARNAETTISATMAALRSQTFAGRYEAIVVDDGSSDRTGTLAREGGAHVVEHASARGPAAARNSGRQAAAGRLLAFTDADCEPAPDWLERGWSAAAHADLVQGAVGPTPGVPVGPFDRTLRVGQESPRLFETANLFVWADWFDRVGGFRAFGGQAGEAGQRPTPGSSTPGQPTPGLRPSHPTEHFGEDAVFGWESRRLGARFAFEPRAEVHHAVFPRGARDHVVERWRLRFMPTLVREIPELAPMLVARTFLSGRTARFDLALLGLGWSTARRAPGPLLLTLPYLVRWPRTDLWRASAWQESVAVLASDLTSLAALARGSVAARRLVL